MKMLVIFTNNLLRENSGFGINVSFNIVVIRASILGYDDNIDRYVNPEMSKCKLKFDYKVKILHNET